MVISTCLCCNYSQFPLSLHLSLSLPLCLWRTRKRMSMLHELIWVARGRTCGRGAYARAFCSSRQVLCPTQKGKINNSMVLGSPVADLSSGNRPLEAVLWGSYTRYPYPFDLNCRSPQVREHFKGPQLSQSQSQESCRQDDLTIYGPRFNQVTSYRPRSLGASFWWSRLCFGESPLTQGPD
jgi:hypothetical protein